MDVIDIERQAKADDKKTVYIFNPLKVDFQGKYDNKELPEYLIPSKENKSFIPSLAKVFGNHLVDLFIADKKNYPRDRAKKIVFSDD